MSGRRRPRPRTLRTRLVVASVALIAVVCAVIGTVTTVALRSHLYDQLDKQLHEVAMRVSGFGPPGEPEVGGGGPQRMDLDEFVTHGPQPRRTIVAEVRDGAVLDAKYGMKDDESTDFSGTTAVSLTEAERAALASVPRDGDQHTVGIGDLGDYRVEYRDGYYAAVPTSEVTGTISTLIIVEASVTAAGLVAASLAGTVIVGVATRPLRRVAATATRVSELPLHTGEVNLDERVPESECDPHTEVGRVGAALNRMLNHVHGALHARQESETRVRRFVADASHELRTPLASIRGYAELTRRGRERVGPDTRHALGRIESEAGRMTLLVEDLLLLARLDAGRPLEFGQPTSYRSSWTPSATPARPGSTTSGAWTCPTNRRSSRRTPPGSSRCWSTCWPTPAPTPRPAPPSPRAYDATAPGCSWTWRTTGRASPPSCCRTSSNGSRAVTPRGPARPGRPASAWPSCRPWRPRTAAP